MGKEDEVFCSLSAASRARDRERRKKEGFGDELNGRRGGIEKLLKGIVIRYSVTFT